MKSYGGIGTYVRLGPSGAPDRPLWSAGRPGGLGRRLGSAESQVEAVVALVDGPDRFREKRGEISAEVRRTVEPLGPAQVAVPVPGTAATYAGRRRKVGVVGDLFAEGMDNALERFGTEPGNGRVEFVSQGECLHDFAAEAAEMAIQDPA